MQRLTPHPLMVPGGGATYELCSPTGGAWGGGTAAVPARPAAATSLPGFKLAIPPRQLLVQNECEFGIINAAYSTFITNFLLTIYLLLGF